MFWAIVKMKYPHLLPFFFFQIMGSFKGHALPGTFFIIMALWWSTKGILKYIFRKQKRTCYLGSKALFRRAEILEGTVLVCMALTGEWLFLCSSFRYFHVLINRYKIKTQIKQHNSPKGLQGKINREFVNIRKKNSEKTNQVLAMMNFSLKISCHMFKFLPHIFC